MKHKKLLERVITERGEFQKAQHKFFPTYAPTQPQVIELVDLYFVDKFRDGDTTPEGWKRAFYNYVRNPTLVSAKQVDPDTKDVLLIPMPGMNPNKVWLAQIDLQQWMKKTDFGQLLNCTTYKLPKYGSFVIQKIGNEIYDVPLQYLSWNINKNRLCDQPFIIQEHHYSEYQIKEKEWEDVTAVIANAKDKRDIKFFSRFGELEGESKNFWVCDEFGNVVYSTQIDKVDDLYRKHDWESLPDRALGHGVPETLFEGQIQINRVQNYKTKGLHWTSKHLWQTRDVNFRKNLTTDVEDGDVLTGTSELTPVSMEERNLAAYREEEQRWDSLRSSESFSYPELSGERPPAGTPLGTTQIQTIQASSYFDLKKENLGLFWADVIEDWVLPNFKNDTKKEHSILISELAPEDIERVRTNLETNIYNDEVFSFVGREGRIPTFEETKFMQEVARASSKKTKELLVPDSYYDNLEYTARVIITNEQLDVGAKLASFQTLIAMKAQNPAVFNDPGTRTLVNRMLNLVGESPLSLGFDEVSEAPVGGSIARPALTPAMAPNIQ